MLKTVVVLLLLGCASTRASVADDSLRRLRCADAALATWEMVERRQALLELAATCGPTELDCAEALAEFQARVVAAKAAVRAGYELLSRGEGALPAAELAAAAARVAAGEVGANLSGCQ